jgi:hypothetical protein
MIHNLTTFDTSEKHTRRFGSLISLRLIAINKSTNFRSHCVSHGAAGGTRFCPTILDSDGLRSLDRLAAIHLCLVPHFLLILLLLSCFLTSTFVTCRAVIFFLSELHLSFLSVSSLSSVLQRTTITA